MQNIEPDIRIVKASKIMNDLQRLVVMKQEFSKTMGLSIFKSVFVSVLTYGLKT